MIAYSRGGGGIFLSLLLWMHLAGAQFTGSNMDVCASRPTCFVSLQVDKINSQVASRLVSCFTSWRQLDSERQAMMKSALQRIVETNGLSDNVFEIASKALQD